MYMLRCRTLSNGMKNDATGSRGSGMHRCGAGTAMTRGTAFGGEPRSGVGGNVWDNCRQRARESTTFCQHVVACKGGGMALAKNLLGARLARGLLLVLVLLALVGQQTQRPSTAFRDRHVTRGRGWLV